MAFSDIEKIHFIKNLSLIIAVENMLRGMMLQN